MERGVGRVSEAALPPGERTEAMPSLAATPADEVAIPGTRSTALPVHTLRARRTRGQTTTLLLLDVAMIVVGFVLAYVLRYVVQFGGNVAAANFRDFSSFLPTLGLLVGTALVVLVFKGGYRLPRNATWLAQASVLSSSLLTAVALTIIITSISNVERYSRLIFVLAFVATLTMTALGRLGATLLRNRRWRSGRDLERVLVVGGMGLARQVMATLRDRPALGYDLVGFVADQTPPPPDDDATRPPPGACLGGLAALAPSIAQRGVERVIVALPFWENHRLPKIVDTCYQLGVPFQVVPDFYELSFDRVSVEELGGVPLIDLRENAIRGWNYAIKRALDVGLVVATLPLWGLLSLVIMLLIRLDSPGNVIFRQTRIGRNGRPFEFLKFRTMVPNAEHLKADLMHLSEGSGPMFKMKHDPRVTRVGGWLRRTSLDELPQFWNVLRGEMSLVGPRPVVPEEVAQYEPWQRRRLEVTPGCTGLWQATGRSDTSFDEMVRLDIYYAEHWTFGMDIRIILLTIPALLSGRGAY